MWPRATNFDKAEKKNNRQPTAATLAQSWAQNAAQILLSDLLCFLKRIREMERK